MAEPCTAAGNEEQFYSLYDWCLNPILSFRDLIQRFGTELEAYSAADGWQREEIKINLYLFACALACTADDFFHLRLVNFSPIRLRLPRLWPMFRLSEWFLNSPAMLFRLVIHWRAWRWRRGWDSSIEDCCNLLFTNAALSTTPASLAPARLPKELLNWKMRLPEAFRAQDFTHQDIIGLIQGFCAASPPTDQPTVIVGLRTAGAYFAPLMAAYLKRSNYSRVSWFSIRPKNGLSTWEQLQLRRLARRNAHVLLVDDYPATGSTLRLTLRILHDAKLKPEQISILAPTHAAQPNWIKLAGIDPATRVFTIYPSELFKAGLLQPEAVESWCSEYFSSAGSDSLRVLKNQHIEELNAQLAEHARDGHHVREKRVFEIQLPNDVTRPTRKILVKSVGWGWLGYHAYIAGKRLEGFVPRVIGLRNGLLVMDWIDDMPGRNVKDERSVDVLASYVAARATHLRLTGDFKFESRTYRWTGLDEIVTILRRAYGPYVSRVKTPRLRKELYKYVTTAPTLIDGRMSPDEWLHTPEAIYKADFEHHNFGGAEPDLADPAYDLASAIFEFQLTKEDEERLLEKYIACSGDRTIRERLIVHKIFHASMAMRYAADRIAANRQREESHNRYHRARDFLIYSMNEFCAGLIKVPDSLQWSDTLFFIDVDGVFDQDLLGFPHATESGLQSLSKLQSNGYSVVLNTGRGAGHVRKYCDTYGIQGGIAEFGSFFIDAVRGKDIPLIDPEAAAQLAQCRDAIRGLAAVFMDPGYEYSIRAYRFQGQSSAGLSAEEIRTLLDNPAFDRLSIISTRVDTYIVQKGTDKGTGVRAVKRYVNPNKPVAAIGHSDQDIAMLEAADFAYAPANCSAAVRAMAKRGRCRILKKPCQTGLLAAVEHRLKSDGIRSRETSNSTTIGCSGNLMSEVLRAADRRLF